MPRNPSYQVKEYVDRPYEKFSRSDLAEDRPGTALLMTCNDALARGAVEAGVRVAACYPGAPVTYVLEALAAATKAFPEMHVEWSANEKVSYEVTLGAAMCGVRAICIMKNVGFGWIMDPLVSSTMLGVGGLVIVVADDPGAETTQVEEDNRWLARFAEVPVLEPASLQEAKDMVVYGFLLSEEVRKPVVVRITVRLGYSRGTVRLGAIAHGERQRVARFKKAVMDGWTGYPTLGWPETGTVLLHKRYHGEAAPLYLELMGLHPNEAGLLRAVEASPFNNVQSAGGREMCVITAGLVSQEVREAMAVIGAAEITVAKLGVTYPIPRELVGRLLREHDAVLVVEEIEPIVEEQVRVLATELGVSTRILGKRTGHVPYCGEITSDILAPMLARLLGRSNSLGDRRAALDSSLRFLGERVSFRLGGQFCAGCPEIAPTATLRKVLDSLAGPGIACGDSGCGFVAQYAPVNLANTFVCMGAGLGVAQGIARSGVGGKVAAVMGDSTFFHSGIIELINAVYNRANVLLVILDNKATAETGQQPHPGAFGITAVKGRTKELALEDFIRACQVDYLKVVDAWDARALEDAYREAMGVEGVAVVIAQGTCALIVDRQRKEQKLKRAGAR